MALKHTGLWLTVEGWVDVTDIDNDKVFDTKPSHSHPPHPTTKPPPFHPSSLSNSNPLPSAHSTTHPTPLLLHIVHGILAINHTSFGWKQKKWHFPFHHSQHIHCLCQWKMVQLMKTFFFQGAIPIFRMLLGFSLLWKGYVTNDVCFDHFFLNSIFFLLLVEPFCVIQ